LTSSLVADAKDYAHAEMALWRAKAEAGAAKAKTASVYLISALLVVQAAITALLVGLVQILWRWMDVAWATLIVVVLALAIAGLLAKLGIGALTAKESRR
jgi:hypothetical protein